MEQGLSAQLEQFTLDVRKAGEEVVFVTFPNKTLELHQLILSSSSPGSSFHTANSANTDATVYPPPLNSTDTGVPSKKRKTSSDSTDNTETPLGDTQNDSQNARFSNLVLENKHVKYLHSVIKKECEDLAASIDKVKLWVMLSIPKIEDGDNFGVGVQEEILNELHRAQECAYNLRDSARQSHLARAKICSKLIKYPFIEDYSSALREHDDKQIYSARHQLYDIRNLYATLTDITQKNVAKIRAPRSDNSSGLY
ncbi:hypothetical protein GYMLUDRAFT_32819 [Collybiopsis luxurians FD-317 M1]|nr:hypothetical protein GYMLUDRAFT_32819 [Collybiopsis luxurians FD-317 M1]